MANLTKEAEDRIVELLLAEGLAEVNLVSAIKQQSDASGQSTLSELINRKIISDDMVARATAAIINADDP